MVVEEEGYIAVDDAAATFTSNNASGNIVVYGSSSVTPVMEKVKEAYRYQSLRHYRSSAERLHYWYELRYRRCLRYRHGFP